MDEKVRVTRSSMPEFDEYVKMIAPLWETHWLTNMGTYHKRLEKELCEYLGVPYLSLMVNGHMALELTIQAFDFPKGGEVITTPFTFISTTHAIVRNGLEPVFCDIKLSDYTIDEDKIEELITEKTVAIIPVHVYGNICNLEKIQSIADRHGLKVIYDAAHAFGETINGMGVGNFGDASVFSFHATKVFNTIEGGAVAFKKSWLYEKLYNLKNFGIRSEEVVAEVGANAKMNEFCAAMGLCNLKHVAENIAKRKVLVEYYMKKLRRITGVSVRQYMDSKVNYSYGYLSVLLTNCVRDKIYEALRKENIYARKYFYPITADAACFGDKYSIDRLQNARYAGDNILVLPLWPEMELNVIDKVVDIISDCLGEA